MVNRLIVFSHFDVDNIIDEYVIFYLKQLKKLSCDIVFVTTSKLNINEIHKISLLCIKIICRDNIGYDFLSYKIGLFESDIDLNSYDELVICNDSTYGPLFDLNKIFSDMDLKKCDFWGITKNYEIQKHLQSYFIVIKKNILKSVCFTNFFNSIDILPTKKDIIMEYEVGLSAYFVSNGFKFCSYIKYPDLFDRFYLFLAFITHQKFAINPNFNIFIAYLRKFVRINRNIVKYFNQYIVTNELNPTHFYWKNLLLKNNPFIKIELLRKNPMGMEGKDIIIETISLSCKYPVDLIINHLDRTSHKY